MQELGENLVTIMSIVLTYITGSIIVWWKGRKAKKEVKSGVETIVDKMKTMEKNVSDIKNELSFNGGHSLKDVVHEMKGMQDARFYIQMNQKEKPLFTCDHDGKLDFANNAMSELFGMHYKEMLDKDFMKAIGETQNERDQFFTLFVNSIKNESPFEYTVVVTNQRSKHKTNCIVILNAQRKKTGQVMFYYGEIKVL